MATSRRRKGLTPRQRWKIMKRDGFRCVYCGASSEDEMLVIDHVDPVARGGEDSHENYHTACEKCNAGKRDEPTVAKQAGFTSMEPWGFKRSDWLHVFLAKEYSAVRAAEVTEQCSEPFCPARDTFYAWVNQPDGKSPIVKSHAIGDSSFYFRSDENFAEHSDLGYAFPCRADYVAYDNVKGNVTDVYVYGTNVIDSPFCYHRSEMDRFYPAQIINPIFHGYSRKTLILIGEPMCFIGFYVARRHKGIGILDVLDENLNPSGQEVQTTYIDESPYLGESLESICDVVVNRLAKICVAPYLCSLSERIRNGL